MPIVDLHAHSNASDGQYAPAQLVELASQAGVEVLALTDHDTVDGLAQAEPAARKLGLRLIPGIELGAREHRNLHILGYNVSPKAPGLLALCAKMQAERDRRKFRIAEFLREKGIDIDLREVEELAGGKVIARPHFARVMVRHGYVKDNREAFNRYLDTEEFKRIEREKPSARQCLEAIRQAGGRASLAHPYQLGLADGPLEALVCQLKKGGLEAIECYYPKHTPAQERFYLHLAKKHGLHATGGSDFHGEKVKPEVDLAHWELDVNWLFSQPK